MDITIYRTFTAMIIYNIGMLLHEIVEGTIRDPH
jgi:hypothetical protein